LAGSLDETAGFSGALAVPVLSTASLSGVVFASGFVSGAFGASKAGFSVIASVFDAALTATLALLAEDVVVLSPLDATAGFTSAADLAATAGAFTSVLAVAAGVLGGVLAPLDETGFFGFATPSTFRF
jgi:hypothetical protein